MSAPDCVPSRRNVYDNATGRNTRTQSVDGGGNVTAENVRVYDTLGRLTGYTDADGNVATTTTYDLLSRVATSNDGKATRTYAYDGGTERRGLNTGVADGQAGAFGGTYDADGRLTGQTWPSGIVVATGYDETGDDRSITYTKPGCGQSDCTLFTESVRSSAHGQQRDTTSSLSSRRYGYDNAGRLSTVQDTVNNACTTRVLRLQHRHGPHLAGELQRRYRWRLPDHDRGRHRHLDLRHRRPGQLRRLRLRRPRPDHYRPGRRHGQRGRRQPDRRLPRDRPGAHDQPRRPDHDLQPGRRG